MKSLFPKLLTVRPLPGYRLALSYEDGVEGQVDLSAWAGNGAFAVWKTAPETFTRLEITDDGKLQWAEDLDMDPDAFYLQILGKTYEQYARDQPVLRHTH